MSAKRKTQTFMRLNYPKVYSVLRWLRRPSAIDARRLSPRSSSKKDVFARMYAKGLWGEGESTSGPGSGLDRTRTISEQLPRLITDLRIKKLLDAPCGDFYWMKELKLKVDHYVGADIVEEVIERNQKKYACRDRSFIVLDITTDPIPEADLILCRDCLVHLSFLDIQLAIQNLKKSSCRYLLTTTFTDRKGNSDILTGEWRPLNLQQAPFNFPAPLRLINENRTAENGLYADKSLGLWQIADLP